MSGRAIILLSLLVLIPLLALAWLGGRVARTEQQHIVEQFKGILAQQVDGINQSIDDHFQRLKRNLDQIPKDQFSADGKRRALMRSHPLIKVAAVINEKGDLILPKQSAVLSNFEMEFFSQFRAILLDKDIVRLAQSDYDTDPTGGGSKTVGNSSGWYVWFWGRGIHLLFWRQLEEGNIAIISLPRSRWVADLIASFPETNPAPGDFAQNETLIQIVDSNDQTLYQWGTLAPSKTTEPLIALPVSSPLSSWRIKYFVRDNPANSVSKIGSVIPLVSSIVAIGIALLGIAYIFFREYSREMREAGQRVNFVNQVSHELKTPLTNIRMYADLLEMDIEGLPKDQSQSLSSRLDVIVSESQRLSRLIGNVLTFSKSKRQQLKLRKTTGCIDDIIKTVVSRFRPAFDEIGFNIELQLETPESVDVDQDALEQILENLISNVERYASDGKFLRIESTQNGQFSQIRICDKGPGIPQGFRRTIFQPFYRISSQLSDASGTGIGLTIARSLCQIHGGDLQIEESTNGSSFCIRIQTQNSKP